MEAEVVMRAGAGVRVVTRAAVRTAAKAAAGAALLKTAFSSKCVV